MTQFIETKLAEKSRAHRATLKKLGFDSKDEPLGDGVLLLEKTPQLKGINTIIQNDNTSPEDFLFYFDRMATLLVEQ